MNCTANVSRKVMVKRTVFALFVTTAKMDILQFAVMMGRRIQVNVKLRKHLVKRSIK